MYATLLLSNFQIRQHIQAILVPAIGAQRTRYRSRLSSGNNGGMRNIPLPHYISCRGVGSPVTPCSVCPEMCGRRQIRKCARTRTQPCVYLRTQTRTRASNGSFTAHELNSLATSHPHYTTPSLATRVGVTT